VKIAVFAITGLGNSTLETLINLGHKPAIVVTRKELRPDPYLNKENLELFCLKNNIPVKINLQQLDEAYDLCIVATYHKKILIKKCKFQHAYNIHTSLLPDLKGRDPVQKAIDDKKKFTGVTVHILDEKIDGGEILFQKKITISNFEKKSIFAKMYPIFSSLTKKIIKKVSNDLKKVNI